MVLFNCSTLKRNGQVTDTLKTKSRQSHSYMPSKNPYSSTTLFSLSFCSLYDPAQNSLVDQASILHVHATASISLMPT